MRHMLCIKGRGSEGSKWDCLTLVLALATYTDFSVLRHTACKEWENNVACTWTVRSKEKNIILLSIWMSLCTKTPLSLLPLSSITKRIIILVISSAEHTPVHDAAILKPRSKSYLLLRGGDVKLKSDVCNMQPCFRLRKKIYSEKNMTPYFDSVGAK